MTEDEMAGWHIDNDSKYKLCDMVFDGESFKKSANGKGELCFNETTLANFMGIINNSFTRKRINDVTKDMKGSFDRSYNEMTYMERMVIDTFKSNIISKRAVMYLQSRVDDYDVLCKLAERSFED